MSLLSLDPALRHISGTGHSPLDSVLITPRPVGRLRVPLDFVVPHEQHPNIPVWVLLDDELHLLAVRSSEVSLAFYPNGSSNLSQHLEVTGIVVLGFRDYVREPLGLVLELHASAFKRLLDLDLESTSVTFPLGGGAIGLLRLPGERHLRLPD